MTVLGIDPGQTIGYAVAEIESERLIESGHVAWRDERSPKCPDTHSWFCELLMRHDIHQVVVERTARAKGYGNRALTNPESIAVNLIRVGRIQGWCEGYEWNVACEIRKANNMTKPARAAEVKLLTGKAIHDENESDAAQMALKWARENKAKCRTT